MSTSPKRYGLDVKDDLELELRLRRIEAALEGKLESSGEDQHSGGRSSVPQVTGLRVTGQTPGSVTIAWNAVSISNFRRYDVDFATNLGFSENKQTFTENSTSRTFDTASATGGGGGATWYARVRAVNTFGQTGLYSVTLNLTTGQAQTEDLAPGSVTTVQVTPGGVAATAVSYDNTSSGLSADDVQEAIDELATGTPTPVFTESSTSAQTALTTNGTVTIAHGLTQIPKLVQLTLICTTAEHLFAVGDRILVTSFGSNASFTTERGWTIRVDATNIYIDNASGHIVVNAGGTNWVTLTTANWRWIAYCVA